MFWLAFLAHVVAGAADMASAAFRTSMLQTAASDAIRGRLQGVFIVVVAGGPWIADVLHGAAAWGGVAVIVGVVLIAVFVPSFRGDRVKASA